MSDITRRDLRRLRLLARRDRQLVRSNTLEAAEFAVVARHVGKGAFPEPVDAGFDKSEGFGEAWVKRAEDRGWLERIDGDAWILSRRGRACLKAGLSLLDTVGNSETSTPKTVSQPDRLNALDLAERAGTVLGWLRKRSSATGEPLISEAEFAAGERFRADYFSANAMPNITARLSIDAEVRVPSRDPDNGLAARMDQLIKSRQAVLGALEAVGPELGELLIETCCHERGLKTIENARGWPQRSGKVVLTIALRQLAGHYGLASPQAPRKH